MDRRQKEINRISSVLSPLGFSLEKEQPHIEGERFLASPDKLVLVGIKAKSDSRVIIKMSRLARAKEEIRKEKKVRDILSSFSPFKKAIHIPPEVYFGSRKDYQILITKFIPQKQVFISLPLADQFEAITNLFETRGKLNGNTHMLVKSKYKNSPFLRLKAKTYFKYFKNFQNSILTNYGEAGIISSLKEALGFTHANKHIIELHCDHLVHSDFAPHNFRFNGKTLYTLDCSAFVFGNKHEEMARLLNYMVIHNSALEKKLTKYVSKNRSREEYLSLKLMRIYKIHHLLKFYSEALSKTRHDLLALTTHRVEFWKDVLKCVMHDRQLDEKILKAYLKNRDSLRSAEEKKRQREFAKA